MNSMNRPYDAIIIGAGAAGLMCAITAGARGRRVLLLDHAKEIGKKILISGGGRCNFTNIDTRPDRFLSENKHFCKSALKRFTQHDFIAMVEKHGIAYHEKKLGQLFCDGSARGIVEMLRSECLTVGVDIRTECSISNIRKNDLFEVETNLGDFSGQALVLATGGPSIPKMGATGFAYDIAQQFGLALVTPRPALVPLVFSPEDLEFMTPLSGVSIDSLVRADPAAFRENILFTHRGLSGPAILQISSYWQHNSPIILNLVPDLDITAYLLDRKASRPKAEVKTILSEHLPQRFAQSVTDQLELQTIIGQTQDKALRKLGERLQRWAITPVGTEGFSKAEVTVGGINTDELSSKTMEARKIPGLYVIGEAVDVTGWLGGYNFQWAWSSGYAAGDAI